MISLYKMIEDIVLGPPLRREQRAGRRARRAEAKRQVQASVRLATEGYEPGAADMLERVLGLPEWVDGDPNVRIPLQIQKQIDYTNSFFRDVRAGLIDRYYGA